MENTGMGDSGDGTVTSREPVIFAILGFVAVVAAPVLRGFSPDENAYVAAVYSVGPAFKGEQRLTIFPAGSRSEREIPLPFPLGLMVAAQDGRALYASAGLELPGKTPREGLFRVEFNPVRISSVPGSGEFPAFFSLAVSPVGDTLLISGAHREGPSLNCGVFEIRMADGGVKQILRAPDCHRANARTALSLSPDGEHAVAINHRVLELIDLGRNTAKPIAGPFTGAAWSPDGKWIAALEYSQQKKTILFDARNFSRKRTLPTSELAWSPDSSYLLNFRWQARCGPEIYSLEAINADTGTNSVIDSSKCKLVGGTATWLSSEIVR